jgi:hypothetical protein
MTSRIAIANAPESDHDIRINIRQAGAQTEWVVPPGKQAIVTLDGNPGNMDIRIAEGEPNKILISVDAEGLVALEGIVDSRKAITLDAEDVATLSGDAVVALSGMETESFESVEAMMADARGAG